MRDIRAVAFDTGGTVLDWHNGLVAGLAECGARRRVEHDWHDFANEYRRRSLKRMLGAVEPAYNIDEVHRDVLDELLGETAIDTFSPEDRRTIVQRWHELSVWPDFVPALTRLRQRYVCVSFTILGGAGGGDQLAIELALFVLPAAVLDRSRPLLGHALVIAPQGRRRSQQCTGLSQ
jgi:2-haloacid dehalogenase